MIAQDAEWQRIAALPLEGGVGRNQVSLGQETRFRLIKLRSRGADIEVRRWTLRFEDGTILDLSVNCLLEGTESRPMMIGGRRLKGVAVEYEAREGSWRMRLEIWARP